MRLTIAPVRIVKIRHRESNFSKKALAEILLTRTYSFLSKPIFHPEFALAFFFSSSQAVCVRSLKSRVLDVKCVGLGHKNWRLGSKMDVKTGRYPKRHVLVLKTPHVEASRRHFASKSTFFRYQNGTFSAHETPLFESPNSTFRDPKRTFSVHETQFFSSWNASFHIQ